MKVVVPCSQWPKLQGIYNIAYASFPTSLQCYLFLCFSGLYSCPWWVTVQVSYYSYLIFFSKFGNRTKLRRVREKNCPVEFEYLWKRCRYIIFLLSYHNVKFFSSVEKNQGTVGHRANFWEIADQLLQTLFSHFRATFWFPVTVILIKYLT